MSTLPARLRTSAWLGWQIESNWADPFLFIVYSLLRPIATALILAGMFWALACWIVERRIERRAGLGREQREHAES